MGLARRHERERRRLPVRRSKSLPYPFPRGDARDSLAWQVPNRLETARGLASRIRSADQGTESCRLQLLGRGPGRFVPACFLLRRWQRLEFCQLSIEVAFQFIVEDNSEIRAAILFNLFRCLLIQTIERCIVPSFTGFDEAVMYGLVRGKPLRVGYGPETHALIG